jgi:hypothetical protein
MVALADSKDFLSLDIGNENHIAVLVIILCHNSPQMLLERCGIKYDNMMASCCSQRMPVKIMLYLMKLMRKKDKKTTCICVNVNLRNKSVGVDLWKIKLEMPM